VGRSGDEPLYRTVTNGAFFLVRSAEALEFLELVSTIFAAVFVKRHEARPSGVLMLFSF
jgi:hypothetical protein